MTKPSPFFARIRADVLAIMRAVPKGTLVTFADIGRHLDVAPRHIAYILANLSPADAATVPWHRAVSAEGVLKTRKGDISGQTQTLLLEAEGIAVGSDGRVVDLAAHVQAVCDLSHGIPRQQRPADAPGGQAFR